jgi:hypothetical protein
MVLPEHRDTVGLRKNLDLEHANALRRLQHESVQRSRDAGQDGHVECSMEVGFPQDGQRRLERPAKRAIARTLDHALQRVVPDHHAPVVVDDTHALVERFDHVAMPPFARQAIEVTEVHAIREDHRHDGDEQQSPHPVIDCGDDED